MEVANPPPPSTARAPRLQTILKWLFCLWVLSLALYQFSENTADPDLWGHTLFGQEWLKTGTLAKSEPYSWTATGHPWINHELVSELALGAAHQWFGGTGILLLKMLIGMLTFVFALRLGARKLPWPTQAFAWGFGALAVVELSYGFSPRPQIFTALALVGELWILEKTHDRSFRWALLLPFLFAIWINTHGGVLAGLGLLVVAAVATSLQFFISKSRALTEPKFFETTVSPKVILVLWVSCAAAALALFANPWRGELVQWLIKSVLWLRPEIEEWNPTPLNWDHAALFILIALSAFAWIYSRRRKMAWELLACLAFAFLALRSVRNTPLFAIIALATVPPHLADACLRFRHLISHREDIFRRPQTQTLLLNFLWITLVGIFASAFLLRKEHPLTIEVPRKQYPVSAIEFIRKHEVRGNLLAFFDWGEMCIWELPDSRVSIDGRLDTCYSRELIANHWQVYNAQPHDETVLNLNKADFALLPANLVGALELSKRPDWRAVYLDDTAALLVRNSERFPLLPPATNTLGAINRAVVGDKNSALGRASFPDKPSLRLNRTTLR